VTLSAQLTAYTLAASCVLQWHGLGLTSSGTRAIPGVTAAAARECIRPGTWIELPAHATPDGHARVWIVEDTGSALRSAAREGRCVVDLLVGGDSAGAVRAARLYGRRRAEIRILHVPRDRASGLIQRAPSGNGAPARRPARSERDSSRPGGVLPPLARSGGAR
jgi:3D (Asp-Asp-Asp) domain-containing protein